MTSRAENEELDLSWMDLGFLGTIGDKTITHLTLMPGEFFQVIRVSCVYEIKSRRFNIELPSKHYLVN